MTQPTQRPVLERGTKVLADREVLRQVLDNATINYDYHGNPSEESDIKLSAALKAIQAILDAPSEPKQEEAHCQRCGAWSMTGLSLCNQCNKD